MASIEDTPVWKQIDSASYLFLNRLFEPRDNSLTIILEEAISNKAKTGAKEFPGGVVFEDCSPIEPTEDCRVFKLEWKNYISYCMTEEMIGSCGKYEDEE